ncbi:MAG: UDP-2,3-diacylglucosamine diphosphatase [Gammaproteobacteria bacterium]|nr:UDP-2,3-diacylglucosamine diphosphatase [Gammaproteobacteria bacterium]
MALLFVSDLHLAAERPAQIDAFERLLDAARGSDGLYILGDLFELWLGDDDDTKPHDRVITALARLAASGTPVAVQHGNRDFLLGARFAHLTGAKLLPEYHRDEFYGVPTLLMHGDLLCTRDVAYQEFRREVRDPRFCQQFLAQPLTARRAYASEVRAGALAAVNAKDEAIMDVDPETVDRVMAQYRVMRLIHGHTHRPHIHESFGDGRFYERVVLGDWYESGRMAIIDSSGARLIPVASFI